MRPGVITIQCCQVNLESFITWKIGWNWFGRIANTYWTPHLPLFKNWTKNLGDAWQPWITLVFVVSFQFGSSPSIHPSQAHPFPPSFLFPSFFQRNELGDKKIPIPLKHMSYLQSLTRVYCCLFNSYFMNMGRLINRKTVGKFSNLILCPVC